MSETTAANTELTSQYSAQVTGDLERNLKEQERLGDEIAALQVQLAALRHDQAVLVSIQQALGVTAEPAAEPTVEPAAKVPAARKKPAAASTANKQAKGKKPATSRKRTAKKSTEKTPAAAAAAPATSPTLVDLVHGHLVDQREPRSAAEVTTALAQQYPDRGIKTTVVRTTLEGLVAKNRAQRTKQGSSVFYTTPEAADAPAADEEPAPQSS
ncbi:hypothetical protein ACIHJG_22995 [Streptomyces sp. NPDC052415]|uniref:hypothetical protein n=1 Tax=Streptomyces sp. NPDC052415 TaxID=3365690 RepID=UPI0037D10279